MTLASWEARAIVLVEYEGRYIFAAILPERMDVEVEDIEATTVEDLPTRRFVEGPTYFRIEGRLVKLLAVWDDADEALDELRVRETPIRALLPGG